jgi:CheY-like chemotaxis protein
LIQNLPHTAPKDVDTSQVFNILLAEDDVDDVLIFKMALSELNIAFELHHADNGRDLLLLLLNNLPPDIIFLDINIPYKDGLSCLKEIRQNSAFDNVPVILISGHKYSKYIDDAFTNRANYYLLKANDISQLVKQLKALFSIDWKKVMYYPPISQFVIGNMADPA